MTYSPRLLPRQHQTTALDRARGRRAFGFLMDMGTGKTKVALDEFGEMEAAREVSDLLVVAPAGCYLNWTSDREGAVSEATKHLSPGLRERLVVAEFRAGAGRAHRDLLTRMLACTDRPRLLVVNVEALSTVRAAQELCEEFLARGRAGMIVDESPTIKNHKSARTAAVVQLGARAQYRRILTGLVSPNGPLDVYSQFEFLDWSILGFRSYYSFQAHYAITKKVQFRPGEVDERGRPRRASTIVVGYRNKEDLAARIAHATFRVRKEECLDLPPKTYMTRDVAPTLEQVRVDRELRETATARLSSGSYVSVQMALTMLMRRHQVFCGHVRDEEGVVRPVESNRVAVLLEVLAEHPRKAVIWANYDANVREIAETLRREYGEASTACFWGGNRGTRAQDEARFKGDPRCRWMISTQSAGGRGNTWTGADLTVYFSSDYDLDDRAQSEDRTHRDGQTLPCTYVDLVCRTPASPDERVLRALREKIDMAAVIQRDGARAWVV